MFTITHPHHHLLIEGRLVPVFGDYQPGHQFGPCLESKSSEVPKRCGRKPKIHYDERMYRCECLEPVWPSRSHCLSCHHTFLSISEFQTHNKGNAH
jgi:hypothetical protein